MNSNNLNFKDSIKIVPYNAQGVDAKSTLGLLLQGLPEKAIAIVELDMVGEKVNKFNTAMMARLKEVIDELKTSSYKAVIFKSNKNKIFIAGADIDEIKVMKTKDEFDKAVGAGQSIINDLEDLPQLTIAAISGACAGGGCEFVLACDYRIASDESSTRIGLPETKLGIIPGFGGCIRLPRVVGLANAMDIILNGKLVAAVKAEKMGLVDLAVHPGILMEQAVRMAAAKIKDGAKKRRKTFQPKDMASKFMESFLGRGVVFSQSKKTVLKMTHGHYPAPLVAIDVIKKTYLSMDRTAAMATERAAFCEMAITSVSKSLLHVFDLTEMVKKQTGVVGVEVKPMDVKKISVLGAGTMGGGIAYLGADKGIEVRLKDINYDAIGKGLKHARDLWAKLVKRKSITKYEFQQKMDLISGTTDYSGFGTVDVCVEAIVEDMGIKQKVIGETAKNMREDAIIATNTSSLSVTEMAKGHPRPEFFAGMHFFNPVHKMPLIEVIRGEKTSDKTIATIFELSKKLGKMPVVVKDGPGFLVNRLLLPYMAEAAFLMQEGMSIEVVDRAYVKEFGMPMGPFALMDEVGLDVCIKVLKIFKKAFGERIEIAANMEKLEKSGRMGKKNGKGFYKYDASGKRLEVDEAIYAELGVPQPTNPLTTQECIERGIFAMVNECARALIEDKIVELPAEVDLAMIMGTGFPPFRGGLLKHADAVGSSYIVTQLDKYAAKGAKRLTPSAPLKQLAASGQKFYLTNS